MGSVQKHRPAGARTLAGSALPPYDRFAMRRCIPLFLGRSRLLLGGGLLGLSVLLGGAGCAARRDAAEQQLHALEDQVDLLEGANDRLEARIGALELSARKATGGGSAAPSGQRDRSERPALDVVRLGPSPAQTPAEPTAGEGTPPSVKPAGAAEEDSPRLLIQGSGDRIETRESAPTSELPPRGGELRALGAGVRQDEASAARRPAALAPARRAGS